MCACTFSMPYWPIATWIRRSGALDRCDSVRNEGESVNWLLHVKLISIQIKFYSKLAATVAKWDQKSSSSKAEEGERDDTKEEAGLEPEMGFINSRMRPKRLTVLPVGISKGGIKVPIAGRKVENATAHHAQGCA